MAGEYDINLSNGNVLATLYPLETNGPDNVSTPRIIQEARPAYGIVVANPGGPSFSIAGDFTDVFRTGFVFQVTGSTGNDGAYTVVSSVFSSPNTVITVASVASAVADGSIIAHIFRLNSDLTYRFGGSPFVNQVTVSGSSTAGSPLTPPEIDGTYTLQAIGAAYDSSTDTTIIPVTNGSIRDNVITPIYVPYGNITYSIPDQNATVKLPGKGTANYGEMLIENLVRMVENFAADDAPDLNSVLGTSPAADPLVGQLWYNTTPGSEGFKYWDGSAWVSNVAVGDGSIAFVDIENTAGSPAHVAKMYLAASETNLPAPWAGAGSPAITNNLPGMVVWTDTNPVDGQPIFRVLAADGSETLRIEHNGNLSTLNNLIAQGTGDSFIYGNLGIGTSGPLGAGTALFVSGGVIDAPAGYTDLITSDTHIPNVEYVEAPMRAMSEPTGFENRTDSTISFVDGTRTFTVAPAGSPIIDFNYWIDGAKYTVSSPKTLVIGDVEGMHYIYINSAGALQEIAIFDPETLLRDNAYVCAIYWDATNNTAIYIADERHGLTMDNATHTHFHLTYGTQFVSGLGLSSLVVDGDGSSATHAQFTVDTPGIIRDEDLQHRIVDTGGAVAAYDLEQELDPIAQIPVFYRSGASGDWRLKAADNFPLIYDGTAGFSGTGRAPYNQFTGATWQLTEVADNNYFLMHYLATNDINHPVIGIQGQNEFATVTAARDGAVSELSTLAGLPFEEFTPIATVIFQTATGFSNTPAAAIAGVTAGSPPEEYVDWRDINTFTSVIGGGGITDHGNLSGLTDDDHLQYMHLNGTRAMTGDLTLANSTPTADLHAASKKYVDDTSGGESWREPVRVRDATVYASSAAFPVTGIIDGITLNDQDRVLFTNVTVQADNDVFIYNAGSPSTWTKITTPNTRSVGDVVAVDEGTYARLAFIYGANAEWNTFGSGAGINVRYEAQVAAGSPAETTTFTLAEPYSVGSNRLFVYVDGIKQTLFDASSPTSSDYEETDSTTVTFNVPVAPGSLVEFYAFDELTPYAVSKRETQTGLTGTPVINFTTLSYAVGGNNLLVFLNGQKMIVGTDYTETTSSSITWVNPTLVATDVLEFYSSVPIVAGTKLADVDNVTSNTPNDGDVLYYNAATDTWDVTAAVSGKPGYVQYLNQSNLGLGSPNALTYDCPVPSGDKPNNHGGTATLQVFVNGVYQIQDLNYTNNGDGTITLFGTGSPLLLPDGFDLVIYEFG